MAVANFRNHFGVLYRLLCPSFAMMLQLRTTRAAPAPSFFPAVWRRGPEGCVAKARKDKTPSVSQRLDLEVDGSGWHPLVLFVLICVGFPILAPT